jgi:RimJ/RimL family protein N-acetyltransferase
VGYFIDQKFRGLGIASEALDALKSWAFQDPDLILLRAESPVDNLASQKVLERINFSEWVKKKLGHLNSCK